METISAQPEARPASPTAGRPGSAGSGWAVVGVLTRFLDQAAGPVGTLDSPPPADLLSVQGTQERHLDCRVGARESVLDWLRTTPRETTSAISDAGLVPARAGGRSAVDDSFLDGPLIQETGRLPVDARVTLVRRRAPDVLVPARRDPERFVGYRPTDRAIHDDLAMADHRLVQAGRGRGACCGHGLMVFQR